MEMEYIKNSFIEEPTPIPSIPPGFGVPASFSLERIDVTLESVALQSTVGINEQTVVACEDKFSKCLRQRPCINYSLFDNSSEDESDSELLSQKLRPMRNLPKGVVRGCQECSSCQKVTARWQPEKACKPITGDAPVFYPTEEEFEDTLKYIASIRPKAEPFGICLIVPPPSWNPPCPLKEKDAWENHKFATRVQKINKLQNRHSAKKSPTKNYGAKNKRRRILGSDGNVQGFGFEPGSEFTLKAFESYACDFKDQYFCLQESNGSNDWKPSVEAIEGEYWRMVEKPTEEIEVLYGADIDTGSFGSGFPKMQTSTSPSLDDKYAKSGWNLNNFPRLAGSVLAFEESNISGVLVPWLYVGMCFSSFCWHVEDHHFYSLNYMHWGEPKVWYGVPGGNASKLEAAMKKHLPDLFEEQPDLLHNLVTQFSPSVLKSEGVPVFRCVQNPGQFVLTFPRAYHSGFNCGFNCAEAVNVAPIDWLPQGQSAVELYREQRRKISVSHDKLLLGAAREAVKAQWNILFLAKKSMDNLRWKDASGSNGILARVLKARIQMEHSRRESVCSSRTRKMDANFDVDKERECIICHYDLHLSAVGCSCSPEIFSCLDHGKDLCKCSWDTKFFLFRYETRELNILLDAVGGKLSAVHKWALSDLGLSLSSCIRKNPDNKKHPVSPPHEVSSTKDSKTADSSISSTRSITDQSVSKPTSNRCPEEVREVEDHSNSNHVASNIIQLSDDEGDEEHEVSRDKIKVEQTNQTDNFGQLMDHNTNEVTPSYCKKDESLETPETDACAMDDTNIIVSSSIDEEKIEITRLPGFCSLSTNQPISTAISQKTVSSENCAMDQIQEILDSTKGGESENSAAGSFLHPSRLHDNISPGSGKNCISLDSYVRMHVRGESSVLTGQTFPQICTDRLNRHGPRIAKVVRRINNVVELLELGVVHPGQSWSCERAIFPKGYRSRVRYFSVLEPSQMCYYVSEILDSSLLSPMFMVQMENCPNEVFIHLSATRCWDMVRERVNIEIKKQHNLGRAGVPALQLHGSIDGLEMFGLTSPSIIKAIEAIDVDRVCSEYWKSNPQSVYQQTPEITADSSAVFRGLLRKLNPQELQLLSHTIVNPKQESLKLINFEIESRLKPSP